MAMGLTRDGVFRLFCKSLGQPSRNKAGKKPKNGWKMHTLNVCIIVLHCRDARKIVKTHYRCSLTWRVPLSSSLVNEPRDLENLPCPKFSFGGDERDAHAPVLQSSRHPKRNILNCGEKEGNEFFIDWPEAKSRDLVGSYRRGRVIALGMRFWNFRFLVGMWTVIFLGSGWEDQPCEHWPSPSIFDEEFACFWDSGHGLCFLWTLLDPHTPCPDPGGLAGSCFWCVICFRNVL